MNTDQKKVCRHVASEILEGRFEAGERLPTENELAAEFRTTRMNVHAAMKELERRNILFRKRRVGTFVKAGIDRHAVVTLRNLASNQVAILLSGEQVSHVHWNSHTLTEFEYLLNQGEFRACYQRFPADRAAFEACLENLANAGFRAAVLLPTSGNNDLLLSCMDLMENQPLDIYLLNRGDIPTDRCRCHMLSLDPYDEGVQVGRYIVAHGWDAVTFLQNDWGDSVLWIRERRAGLQEGLCTASRGRLQAKIVSLDNELAGFSMKKIAVSESGAPPVLVTQNDGLAAQLLDRHEVCRRQVGRDFYLLSFDDNPAFRPYNLTTVAPPLSEMAQGFAEVLLGNDLAAPERQLIIKLKSRIVERGTSGPH